MLLFRPNDAHLSLKGTRPRIIDFFGRGILASGVLVATEQLLRVPFPPARRREERLVVVLDCRPILKGLRWLLVSQPCIEVQTIAAMFQDSCPVEHLVSISGAPVVHFGRDKLLTLHDGVVLTIAYTDDMPHSDEDSSGIPPDGDPRLLQRMRVLSAPSP